ncbi:hypothetical protein SAMN05216563_112134 [Phytobacter palmae]|nr:hypothetical protein SAMN05216563_112134 [Phytobacter palmae]
MAVLKLHSELPGLIKINNCQICVYLFDFRGYFNGFVIAKYCYSNFIFTFLIVTL